MQKPTLVDEAQATVETNQHEKGPQVKDQAANRTQEDEMAKYLNATLPTAEAPRTSGETVLSKVAEKGRHLHIHNPPAVTSTMSLTLSRST